VAAEKAEKFLADQKKDKGKDKDEDRGGKGTGDGDGADGAEEGTGAGDGDGDKNNEGDGKEASSSGTDTGEAGAKVGDVERWLQIPSKDAPKNNSSQQPRARRVPRGLSSTIDHSIEFSTRSLRFLFPPPPS